MKFDVLLSCMHEKGNEIIDTSNIKSSAVIVNQCNDEKEYVVNRNGSNIVWIDSTERGLSRSRNMAILKSNADICLIADNDEFFDDDLEIKVLEAYNNLSDADVIIFRLSNKGTKLKNNIYKLKRLEMLRVCSLQISFKRQRILEKNIRFDIKLGAGTGNGAGEENKFLLDCYDAGLKIYYYPVNIASMRENESTWFNGFNEEFFYKRGIVTRYILGFWLSLLYAIYYLLFKYKIYKGDVNIFSASKNLFKGILCGKLG